MKRARGFTLLEVLIALAVLALGMLAVIGTAGSSSRLGAHLRDKTFAGWVGMNELTMLRVAQSWPSDDSLNGDADMGGQKWHWKATMTKTADPDLLRVDIDVSLPDSDEVITTVTGFMGRPLQRG
ncbi:MAG TPA: type II secretion system minor pseudopilin GspI [Gammaproteobacteria bacterium]